MCEIRRRYSLLCKEATKESTSHVHPRADSSHLPDLDPMQPPQGPGLEDRVTFCFLSFSDKMELVIMSSTQMKLSMRSRGNSF